MTHVCSIPTTVHGRYFVRPGDEAGPMLVGFHGYAESAETMLARLAASPAIDAWTLVAVQGLHRFYRRRSDEVVASWMTRQDRELMIADNVSYVSAVIDAVSAGGASARTIVFAGFSQGVSMAFRAACLRASAPAAVVACGGDVPPELGADRLRRIPRALIGRGRADASYGETTFATDRARLETAGVPVEALTFDGGHEWAPPFAAAVGAFLEGVR